MVLPVARSESSFASLMRWASPPESLINDRAVWIHLGPRAIRVWRQGLERRVRVGGIFHATLDFFKPSYDRSERHMFG